MPAPALRSPVSRFLVPFTGLVLLAGACDSPPALEPEVVERVEVCDDLVPIGVELVRRTAEAVEGAPLAVVTGEIPPSDELAQLRAIGREIDLRASRLACDPGELNAAINAETAQLDSDDPVARMYLDVVREGVVGTLPPPPPTTTSTTPPSTGG